MNSAHDRHLAAILGLGLLCGPCLALASDASPVDSCAEAAAAWWDGRAGIDYDTIDPETAIPLCRQAVETHPEHGDGWAHLARALVRAERYDEAQAAVGEAIERGSAAGLWYHGVILASGYGIEPDHAQAVAMYRQAAQRGHPLARHKLGWIYDAGWGVEPNADQAVYWYRQVRQHATPLIERMLIDSDSARRQRAIRWLRRAYAVDSVPDLIGMLDHADPATRGAAAHALGSLGDLRAVEPLMARSIDGEMLVRWSAVRALGDLGDIRAVVPLIERLMDQQEYELLRASAARALGRLGDPRAVDALVRLQTFESRESIRAAAAAVRDIGDPRTVDKLIAQTDAIREAPYLMSAGGALAALLIDFDPERALALFDARWALDDIMDWGLQGTSLGYWLVVLDDPRALPILIRGLKHDDSWVRHATARTLRTMGDTRALNPLLALLGVEEDVDVFEETLRAIGRLGNRGTTGPLLDLLRGAGESWRRVPIAELVANLGDERAIEPLKTLVAELALEMQRDDSSEWARFSHQRVSDALNRLVQRLESADSRTVSKLIERMMDWGDGGLAPPRLQAMAELVHAAGEDAIEPLLDAVFAYHDPDASVVSAALRALDELSRGRALSLIMTRLERDGDAMPHRVGLRLLDHSAIEPLMRRLDNENPEIRRSAIDGLSLIGNGRMVGLFIEHLDDGDWAIRRTAAEALGTLHDERAIQPLIERLNDESRLVRKAALDALEAMNDAGVVASRYREIVHTALARVRGFTLPYPPTDHDFWVRDAALDALDRLEQRSPTDALLMQLTDVEESPRYNAMIQDANPDELEIEHLQPLITHLGRTRLYPLLGTIGYHALALPLTHHATSHGSRGHRLRILGLLWGWEGERTVVDTATLAADLAALRDPDAPAGAEPEAVDANPYVALFLAKLHQENGRHEHALDWVERGLRHAPEDRTALRIVLGWLQAEALWRLDRLEEALGIVEAIETELLPRLAPIEYRRTGLAFDAHTRLLQGLLLQELDREAEALEVLHRAEADLQRLTRRAWYGEEPAARLRALVLSLRAALEHPGAETDAIAARALLELYPPQSLLARHAEHRLLGTRSHLHDQASRAVLLDTDHSGHLLHPAVHGQAGNQAVIGSLWPVADDRPKT